ncbi:X-linked retinitis pigmentosa GTPase regulator-interacting protein 1-like [Nomia melanderi]|uniref:X-linked retinitis pigmentosa GTPase regulator-interacting protein 1-like n=1 Tax=Nomia melanderi TaxID=2448451 RepID=UPI003FCDDFE7
MFPCLSLRYAFLFSGPTSDQEANKKTASKVPNESSSVREFNAVLKNGSSKQDSPSKDDSDDSLKELNDVLLEKNWQQYRKRSFVTYSQLKQNGTSESQDNKDGEDLKSNSLEENTIVIEVVNIILFPKCSVMKNPDIQLLYVEYCFLGYCGADMETISVRKPKSPDQKLTYNFRKKFRVDMERHTAQDNILRSMLNETVNPNIKFIVVCEPIPEETESKECIEIGYAHFNIKKYALGDGEKVTSIPIYTPDESEQIGLLKISVLGFDAIRQRLVKPEASD